MYGIYKFSVKRYIYSSTSYELKEGFSQSFLKLTYNNKSYDSCIYKKCNSTVYISSISEIYKFPINSIDNYIHIKVYSLDEYTHKSKRIGYCNIYIFPNIENKLLIDNWYTIYDKKGKNKIGLLNAIFKINEFSSKYKYIDKTPIYSRQLFFSLNYSSYHEIKSILYSENFTNNIESIEIDKEDFIHSLIKIYIYNNTINKLLIELIDYELKNYKSSNYELIFMKNSPCMCIFITFFNIFMKNFLIDNYSLVIEDIFYQFLNKENFTKILENSFDKLFYVITSSINSTIFQLPDIVKFILNKIYLLTSEEYNSKEAGKYAIYNIFFIKFLCSIFLNIKKNRIYVKEKYIPEEIKIHKLLCELIKNIIYKKGPTIMNGTCIKLSISDKLYDKCQINLDKFFKNLEFVKINSIDYDYNEYLKINEILHSFKIINNYMNKYESIDDILDENMTYNIIDLEISKSISSDDSFNQIYNSIRKSRTFSIESSTDNDYI